MREVSACGEAECVGMLRDSVCSHSSLPLLSLSLPAPPISRGGCSAARLQVCLVAADVVQFMHKRFLASRMHRFVFGILSRFLFGDVRVLRRSCRVVLCFAAVVLLCFVAAVVHCTLHLNTFARWWRVPMMKSANRDFL